MFGWLWKHQVVLGVLSSALISGVCLTAWADDGQIWPVKGKLVSKDGNKSEDVSGIACIGEGFPRSCLVIDDNMQAAQFVTLRDGELTAGETVQLIHNQFNGKPLELDGEGVAYADADHAFYVIGSHGHPRDKKEKLDPVADHDKITARIEASSQVIRIQLNPTVGAPITGRDVSNITSSPKLREIIAAEPASGNGYLPAFAGHLWKMGCHRFSLSQRMPYLGKVRPNQNYPCCPSAKVMECVI